MTPADPLRRQIQDQCAALRTLSAFIARVMYARIEDDGLTIDDIEILRLVAVRGYVDMAAYALEFALTVKDYP